MGHNASTMPSMAPSMDNSSMTMHHGPTHEMSNGTSKNMMTSGTGQMMMNNGTHPMTNNGTTNSTGSMNHGQTMSNGTMSHGNTMPDGGAHGTQSTGSMTHGGAHGTQSTGTMPPGSGHGAGHGSGHPQSTGTMPPGSGHGAGHPTDGSSVATAGGGHGSGHGSGGGSTSGHYVSSKYLSSFDVIYCYTLDLSLYGTKLDPNVWETGPFRFSRGDVHKSQFYSALTSYLESFQYLQVKCCAVFYCRNKIL